MSTVSLDDRREPGSREPIRGVSPAQAGRDDAARAPAAHEIHFHDEEELVSDAFDLLGTDEDSLRETFLPVTTGRTRRPLDASAGVAGRAGAGSAGNSSSI